MEAVRKREESEEGEEEYEEEYEESEDEMTEEDKKKQEIEEKKEREENAKLLKLLNQKVKIQKKNEKEISEFQRPTKPLDIQFHSSLQFPKDEQSKSPYDFEEEKTINETQQLEKCKDEKISSVPIIEDKQLTKQETSSENLKSQSIEPKESEKVEEKEEKEKEKEEKVKSLIDQKSLLKKYENYVYLGVNGSVVCFDVSDRYRMNHPTDAIVWKTKLEPSIFAANNRIWIQIEPESDTLFCSQSRTLYSLNMSNGKINWKVEGEFKHKSQLVLVLEEGIWTIGSRHLHCFSKENGKILFYLKLKVTSLFKFCHTSGLNYDSKYIYVFNQFSITKIERKTKKLIYDEKPTSLPSKTDEDTNEYGNSLFYNGMVYDDSHLIVSCNGYLHFIDHKKNVVMKRHRVLPKFLNLFSQNHGVSMILRNQNTLIISCGDKIFSLNPITFQVYWIVKGYYSNVPVTYKRRKRSDDGQPQTCLTQDEKYIYVHGGGRIKAINPIDGSKIWETRLKGCLKMFVSCILNVEKDTLFLGCRGHFYGVDRNSGKLLFHQELKGFGRSHITLSHFSKYSRNMDHFSQPMLQANWTK